MTSAGHGAERATMESRLKVLGHPVHPMLVMFPVALFVTAVLFDFADAAKSEHRRDKGGCHQYHHCRPPAQAEVLLFARSSGTIDVVYRSANDTDQVATDGVILKTLIDKYGVLPPTVILAQTP